MIEGIGYKGLIDLSSLISAIIGGLFVLIGVMIQICKEKKKQQANEQQRQRYLSRNIYNEIEQNLELIYQSMGPLVVQDLSTVAWENSQGQLGFLPPEVHNACLMAYFRAHRCNSLAKNIRAECTRPEWPKEEILVTRNLYSAEFNLACRDFKAAKNKLDEFIREHA